MNFRAKNKSGIYKLSNDMWHDRDKKENEKVTGQIKEMKDN